MAGPRIDRSGHRRPRAVLVAAALVALLAGACSSGGTGHPSAHPHPPTGTGSPASSGQTPSAPRPKPEPPFRFRIEQVKHVLTSKLGPKKTRRALRRSIPAIRDRMNRLYRGAFVQPKTWRRGRFGPVFQGFFTGVARTIARKHPRTLTLGPDAGRRFASVHGAAGRLKIRVLIGRDGTVGTAFVRAWFTEKAVQRSGGAILVVSDARYFLRHGKRGWWVEGFTVRRHDHRSRT